MSINIPRARQAINDFDWKTLFIEELGWSRPAVRQQLAFVWQDEQFTQRQIAQLAGVVVFEIAAANGSIPDAKTRSAIQSEIAKQYHENLLIFVDSERTQSLWYWVKLDGNRRYPREHLYVKG